MADADVYLTVDDVDYDHHGKWVKHRKFRWEGRIAYTIPQDEDGETSIVVMWEPHGKGKRRSAGTYRKQDLLAMKKKPEPWYNMQVILRRKVKVHDGR